MPRSFHSAALASALLLFAVPAGAEILGAGSGATGGIVDGKTNESGTSLRTGADTGSEPVTGGNGKAANGTGDTPVLNAPGDKVPGTVPKSQPSNLNGQ